MAERAVFAQVDHCALEAFVLQHVGDRIRDVALGDAVQRDRHAGPCESDRGRAALDPTKVHQRPGNVMRAGEDVGRIVGMRPEMRFIKLPQGLHRNVERAAGEHTQALAFLDELAQLGRRPRQSARCIQTRDFAVRPIEAEDPLEAFDLDPHFQDRALGESGVGMPQRQLRHGIEHLAMPAVEFTLRRTRANARDHQRQARRRRDDAQDTAARGKFPVRHFSP